MASPRLYKYLDIEGGLKMLRFHNLRFTNATKFNDPFDCHPALFDYSLSSIPTSEDGIEVPPDDFLSSKGENDMENLRNNTWICSLSKVHDSLLMWSYYNNHEGICIGLDMEKLRPSLANFLCCAKMGALELEVKYEEIKKKPNYFFDKEDFWGYQASTKAKAWAHEQEVRLALLKPSPGFILKCMPKEYKKGEVIDWKEPPFYSAIDGNCFESVYLGINIDKEKKKEVIQTARKLNPEIKIFQMTADPEAFKLKEEACRDC